MKIIDFFVCAIFFKKYILFLNCKVGVHGRARASALDSLFGISGHLPQRHGADGVHQSAPRPADYAGAQRIVEGQCIAEGQGGAIEKGRARGLK